VILSVLHPDHVSPRAVPCREGRSTTLELIHAIYESAPHAVLYTPLCKIAHVLHGCHSLVSTDGAQLSAAVAYTEDSIEFAWALPHRGETLRNLLMQVKRRLKAIAFLPVMEGGRRRWSETLGLRVLGRSFRARYRGAPGGPVEWPAGFTLAPCDPARDLAAAAALINEAYPSLPNLITATHLAEMAGSAATVPEGWFFLRDEATGRPAGLAITGLCRETGEGFIDWIELLPRYRQRGLGRGLVQEAIHRLSPARFITVSGSLDAPFAAGDLYRHCGFDEVCHWTILGQRAGSKPR
jgi:GNAT superfamily N-acetyltransferase